MNSKKSFLSRIFHDPYLDWMVMLLVTLFTAICFIAVGFFVYSETTIKLSSDPHVPAPNLMFDTDLLSSTLKKYNERAAQYDLLMKRGYIGPADPSL